MNFIRHEENLDTDINIVPIIDCLVMLICFMLFTAAFTQLVYLEAKMTSNTAVAADKSRAEMDQFRLVVTFMDNGMELKTTGSAVAGGSKNQFFPLVGGAHDFKALHAAALALKSKYPDRFSADIEMKLKKQETLDYQNVLAAIDAMRHLTDEEFGSLRTVQKKIRNMPLSSMEEEKKPTAEVQTLAQAMLNSEIAKNTDHKLLFPDIALVGVN